MITIEELSRAYGDFKAVNNISFKVEKGEIVGLLGHNGAGKTTIMKMLSGYLEPSAGRIEIDGLDIARDRTAIQKQLGYLPESLPVYPELNVADYLDYAANLKGLTDEKARDEIRRAIKATDIGDKLLATIGTLSRGYKQRVGVAQAILGQPNLLILDEPTNGLDPTQTQQMRKLIREIARNATVILSTHIMQEVDALCDRALIMRSGELALDARLEDLRNSHQLNLITDVAPQSADALLKNIDGIDRLQGQETPQGFAYNIAINTSADSAKTANSIARALIENGHALYEIRREHRDLETVFREVTEKEDLADAA
ncbi:MAG: ABC transporter ATP-binding protein [Gammaproteobacteria bacterium]|jgi:ABC-2 type transport system ATP-binding protein